MEMQNEGPENAGTSSEQRANVQNAKTAWADLASRCERATGPDREIDKAISKAATGDSSLTPHTASLDAITALIERELPDMEGIIPLKGKQEAWLWPSRGIAKGWRCTAATPALALCAAFCRAMAEKDNEDDNQS